MRYSDVSGVINVQKASSTDYQNPADVLEDLAFDLNTLDSVSYGNTVNGHANVPIANGSVSQLGGYGPTAYSAGTYYYSMYVNVNSQNQSLLMAVTDPTYALNYVILSFATTKNVTAVIFVGGVSQASYADIVSFEYDTWYRVIYEINFDTGNVKVYWNDSEIINYTGGNFPDGTYNFGFALFGTIQWSYDRPYIGTSQSDAFNVGYPDLPMYNGNNIGNVFSDEAIYFRNIGLRYHNTIPLFVDNDLREEGILDIIATSEADLIQYIEEAQKDIKNNYSSNIDWNVVRKTRMVKDGVIFRQAIIFEEIKHEV